MPGILWGLFEVTDILVELVCAPQFGRRRV
jgi:hypothetical protein